MSRPAPKHLSWFDNPLAELLALAWPIAVSMLSFTVMTLIDTLFVGRLGPSALAGVGLGGTAAFVVICFGIGLLRAVKIQISQAVGAGNRQVVGEIVGSGLTIAATLGLICSAVGLMLAPLLTAVAESRSAGSQEFWARCQC
jgi:multidrug resistance protein, MATE family